MGDVVGIGIARTLVDPDGDSIIDASANALKVVLSGSSVNIGDVDVLSVVPGTGATNLGKIEDEAHSNGDVGVLTFAVRRDTSSSMVGQDGDYTALQTTAVGHLRVNYADVTGASEALNIAGTNTANSQYGHVPLVMRNDTLATAHASHGDGQYTYLQVNSDGALYVTGGEVENAAVQSEPMLMGGRYDSSARTLHNGEAGAVALNASGHVIMDVVDGGVLESVLDGVEGSLSSVATTSLSASTNLALYLPLLATIDADTNTMQGNLINIGNAIYADDDSWTNDSSKHILVGGLYQSSMQSVTDGDVAPFQVDANGVLRTSHSITRLASDSNEDVGDSTAEVLKSSTACKRVDMQADSANTGYIYVGGSDVSATKGIRLAPGDFYSIDCDNTADIYVLASVDEEDIHFTYYT